MQLTWSRIWTCVAVSISYDDSHYTTGTLQCDLIRDCKPEITKCNLEREKYGVMVNELG